MIQQRLEPETGAGNIMVQIGSTRRERRLAASLATIYAAVILALAIFARIPGPPVPETVSVLTTGIIISDIATALLLFGQLGAATEWPLLLIACAYLFSAMLGLAHLLTFPGAILPGQPVFGSPQLTSYLFNGWRLGFAALMLVAMAWRDRAARISGLEASALAGLGGMVVTVVVAAGVLMGIVASNDLPATVQGTSFTPGSAAMSWAAEAMGIVALLLAFRRARNRRLFDLWLALALVAFCGDLFLGTVSNARFTLGWYAGRASGFLSSCTLFLFFLTRFARQQRTSLDIARALRERTLSLQLEIARRSDTEARLVQSQKMEAMGQLTGGIAHDFNNLLAAIVGNLDLLRRRQGLDARAKTWVESALAAAERGSRLTSQLLVFSRSQRLELRPVVVGDVILAMRDMLERSLGPRISITCDLDPGDTPVLTEPTQLELAVLNLALNARDAMPDGGELRIAIKPHRIDREGELQVGSYLALSVTDTGTGMPPEVLARAFEPFFTTKGVGKGTGLGLAQVFGIAHRAGGTVRIDSELGKGTTVTMLMRRSDAALPAADEPMSTDTPLWTSADAATVLIIDDDPDVREFLVEFVTEIGLNAVQAADGHAGLAMVEMMRPDLLLVDYAMPGIDGAEIARQVRERHPRLPIVFVTGYADTVAIEKAVGPGAQIVKKPFRASELQWVIAEAIRSVG